MAEEGAEGLLCTYASSDSVEVDTPSNLADFWEGPESYFLVHGVTQEADRLVLSEELS